MTNSKLWSSRITERARQEAHLVSQFKLLFTELHATAKTLGNAEPFIVKFASELEGDTTEPRAALRMDTDTRRNLRDNGPEMSRLYTRRSCQGAETTIGQYTRYDERKGARSTLTCHAWGRKPR